MSKRVRGTVRTHRPGTRPASERVAGARRRTLQERPSQLAEAAVVADAIVAEAPSVDAVAESQSVPRTTHSRHRIRAGSLLAARAATEYVYVAQDMRRILAVAAVLIAALIVLWVLIVVLKVVELPFY